MHNKFPPPGQIQRNPLTHQRHRQEVFWQITFPLALGVLLVLIAGGGVLAASITGGGPVGKWADVSLIWLIAPALVFSLIFLALVVGLVVAITWLLDKTPLAARRVQDVFTMVRLRLASVQDKISEPFMRLETWRAGLRSVRRAVRRALR